MSESLLLNLIELLAIASKFRTDRDRIVNIINFFLRNQLEILNTGKYETAFKENWVKRTELGDTEYAVNDSTSAVRICTALNGELTQQQKLSILIVMFSIVEDNRSISETELQFLKTVSDMFNIDEETFFLCVSFNLLSLNNDIGAQGSLVAFSDHNSDLKRDKVIDLARLEGSISILKIDSTNSYFVKYMGEQRLSLNDVPMLDRAVYDYTFGDVIRLESGEALHFSDIASEISNDQGKILLEVEKISYTFANGTVGLHELSFSETSGRLIGLMGASGAGKSTLLEILNGNLTPKTGHVWINNIDIHKEQEKIEGVIGYVPQDDLLIEDLTVFQNLYYAAKLGFSDRSEHELGELVRRVISDLELDHIAHHRVGSPLKKIISGGQRKRVNIGLELLRAPSVLFLDEPTSGLSSRDSQNIMDLLKTLSLSGKLIFVVIHQPSQEIFKLFDRLLIMDTGGYPIYYGNPLEAITYFKGKTNRLNKEIIYERGQLNPEIIFDLIEAKTVTEFGKHTNKRRTAPVEWYYEFRKKFVPLKKIFNGPRLEAVKAANWITQLVTFVVRDTISKLNNRQYMLINILQAPVLAVFLAVLNRYYDISVSAGEYVFSENQNLPVFLFISIIVALFMGLTVSAEEIVQDRRIRKREKFLNLSRSSYLISKLVILFAMSAFQTLAFWLISMWIIGISKFSIMHFALLFSASAFANMLGLNISSMFNRAITVYILIPILLIPQLVLGGIVLQFDKINPDLKSGPGVPIASELMASRWIYEGLMVSFFMENDYNRSIFKIRAAKHKADHQFMYRTASLEARIQHALEYSSSNQMERLKQIEHDLEIVRNELSTDPVVRFPRANLLRPGCSSDLLNDALLNVDQIKTHWMKESAKAFKQEEQIFKALEVVNQGPQGLNELRRQNHNETIEKYVRDLNADQKMIEKDGRIQVLADPIYREPDGNRLFSTSHFFSPYKYFLGLKLSTPVFNIIVLWLMTGSLYISLYFNWLRRANAWVSRGMWLRFVNTIFGKNRKL
jgi:ABC-type multidrug transport system ATPase subunit